MVTAGILTGELKVGWAAREGWNLLVKIRFSLAVWSHKIPSCERLAIAFHAEREVCLLTPRGYFSVAKRNKKKQPVTLIFLKSHCTSRGVGSLLIFFGREKCAKCAGIPKENAA